MSNKEGGIAKFEFRNKTFEIKITYGYAIKVLKKEYGINLLNLFEDNNMETLINKLSLNDEFAMDLWWSFISTAFSDKEEAIDKLTPDNLREFREAMWVAIENFFDPMRRKMIQEVKESYKDLLMEQMRANLKQLRDDSLRSGSSNTLESVE